MSIVATTDGDETLAQRLCAELGQALWDRREQLLQVRPIHSIDDGVREAMARNKKPVMLVDLGDDPGKVRGPAAGVSAHDDPALRGAGHVGEQLARKAGVSLPVGGLVSQLMARLYGVEDRGRR